LPLANHRIQVNNSLCTTSSIVFAVIRTNDSTAVIKNVVPGAGSFTINLNAPATAETSVRLFHHQLRKQRKTNTMRYITLLLLFAAATTTAQTIVQDSSWLTNTGGIFFANRYQLYDNGNSTTTVTKVGDTTAVITGAQSLYQSQGATMASDAIILSANGAKIREIVRQDELLKTQIGKSALNAIAAQIDTTQNSAKKYFTQSGWTLRDGSTTTAIVFSFAPATAQLSVTSWEQKQSNYPIASVIPCAWLTTKV
jgi:hypothetical protein